MTGHAVGHERQDGHGRQVVAVVWVLSVVLAAAGVVFAVWAGQSLAAFAQSFSLGSFSAAVSFSTVGAVIATQRPGHVVAQLFLGLGLVFALTTACAGYALQPPAGTALPAAGFAGWLLNWVWVPSYALLGVALLVFPDGALPSPRWRPLAWLVIVSTAVTTIVYVFAPSPWLTGTAFTNPLRLSDPAGTVTVVADYAQSVTALVMIPAAASLLVRLRRAGDEQRRQVRLFCIGSAVAVVAYIALGWAGVPWLGFTLTWPLIAFAAGAGIVRHRLFDVDAVLSRALVLALLTAFVAVVYVVVVGGVGTLAGVGRDDPLLAIVAAGSAAVAFEPVRRRARDAADRLVYGRRLSPYEVLAQFAGRLRDPVPAAQLVDDLVRLLADGTGAAHAQAWLRVGDRLRLAAAWPDDVTSTAEIAADEPPHLPHADLVQPVRDGHEVLGVLALRTHPGDVVTSGDRELAASLAGQAGLVLRNARLAAELRDSIATVQASRRRMITAQDDERRRLERDIHDGVQQHLLGLKAKLGAAQELVDQHRADDARPVLKAARTTTDNVITELRDLARGVYPPLLAERGLVDAIRSRARSAPMAVHVRADGIDRLPGGIEAALYYCFVEALQNATRHAAARHLDVHLHTRDEDITATIRDDGVGFDTAASHAGVGLRNLRDRVEAIGGTLTVHSTVGQGTTIIAAAPVRTEPG